MFLEPFFGPFCIIITKLASYIIFIIKIWVIAYFQPGSLLLLDPEKDISKIIQFTKAIKKSLIWSLIVQSSNFHLKDASKDSKSSKKPPRGSAAAAASLRRRRTTSSRGRAALAGGNTMLQFFTDDAPDLKISPTVVLVMSIGFIAFVAVLHVVGKFYFVPRDLERSHQ
ncbi:hypothetical protein AMTRI_Chr07g74690 [Amborella trichopoda]